MQIEVQPTQSDQRPANLISVQVWNHTNQQGFYQLLPNGMQIQINANANLAIDLANGDTAFHNAGNVILDIQWLP